MDLQSTRANCSVTTWNLSKLDRLNKVVNNVKQCLELCWRLFRAYEDKSSWIYATIKTLKILGVAIYMHTLSLSHIFYSICIAYSIRFAHSPTRTEDNSSVMEIFKCLLPGASQRSDPMIYVPAGNWRVSILQMDRAGSYVSFRGTVKVYKFTYTARSRSFLFFCFFIFISFFCLISVFVVPHVVLRVSCFRCFSVGMYVRVWVTSQSCEYAWKL